MCTAHACMKWFKDLSKEIFENEEDFMAQCWKNGKFHHEPAELMGFYFSDEQCKITILFEHGVSVLDTVDTSDVLEWYTRRSPKLSIIGKDVIADDNVGNRIQPSQDYKKNHWNNKKTRDGSIQKSDPKHHFSSHSIDAKPKKSYRKPVDPKDAPPMDVTNPEILADVTRCLQSLRPSREDKALNAIKSIFQYRNGIREQDKKDMFAELIRKGYIFMDNNGVISYKK